MVLATGSVPYDAQKLEHLGYGKLTDVITAADLEAQFKAGSVTRPSNGQPVGSAAFVLCAGSRDAKHLAYCSAACCVESLKQAKMFKTANPDHAGLHLLSRHAGHRPIRTILQATAKRRSDLRAGDGFRHR